MLTLEELVGSMQQIGAEQTDIGDYDVLLEHAKENKKNVKLHAGICPWPYASIAALNGKRAE